MKLPFKMGLSTTRKNALLKENVEVLAQNVKLSCKRLHHMLTL